LWLKVLLTVGFCRDAAASAFFGSGIPFAIYTAWMLLLVWIWAIVLAGQHRTPEARQPGHG
jgi:hypothetical protein